jgi:translation initiation factor 3 subunit C
MGVFVRSRFVDSDDDEDEKRVVKSAQDKRTDELQKVVKDVRNHKKINDWVSLQSDFDSLQRVLAKARMAALPAFVTACLVELDAFIKASADNKDMVKKMSKVNAKALVAMKQKFKKFIKPYEAVLASFKQVFPCALGSFLARLLTQKRIPMRLRNRMMRRSPSRKQCPRKPSRA